MRSTTLIKIPAMGLDFPEGPAFDSGDALWCVELKGGDLVRFEQGRLGLVVTEAEKGLLLSLTGLGPGLPFFTPNGAPRPADPMSP